MNPRAFEKIEMPGIKNIIVGAMGKSGIGKSRMAANLTIYRASSLWTN
jgi:hypothetical protein